MMRQLFGLMVMAVVLAAAALWLGLRSYRVFTHEEQVAVVSCRSAPQGAPYRFVMQVSQMQEGRPGPAESFPMAGDQWSIGGDILKWKPWVTFLSVPTLYKLTRLNSRYWNAADEKGGRRTVYDLNGGSSEAWRFLYRYGAKFPLVDAVYGSSAYIPLQAGGRWGVYVSLTGFLIRPLLGESKG